MNPLTFKKTSLLITFVFSLMSFNILACTKSSSVKKCSDTIYSAERYRASRDLIRLSQKLRILKLSDCRKKVNILDHVASDLATIRKNLSKDGKFRLSKELPVFKKQALSEIKQKINNNKRISDNIDGICRNLENEYKGRYKKLKRDFFNSMDIKTNR